MKELGSGSTSRERSAAGPAEDRATRVDRLREQLAAGTYRPDPAAVASALLARLAVLRALEARDDPPGPPAD
jgi:anti-sigma28 factor (negative regulator of flagellin synthesis)